MTGYEALREGAAWLDLSDRGRIRAIGEDRARLLHAMCTNHVQALSPGQGLYAFFLNDKGRILADANIYNLGESLFLDTEPETRQKIFEHLDRFIIADDVTLEDESELLAEIGLEGPQALSTAASLEIPVGETKFSVREFGSGFTVRTSATGAEGLRIFLNVNGKAELISRLTQAGAIFASADEARTVRIENGIPRYGEEITERYLVQETQALHAVHNSKGCYLGQEIVERVRSRGQVHRLLMPIQIASAEVPAPGTKVTSPNQDVVAEIASAVFSPARNQAVGMAYVRSEAASAKLSMTLADSDPAIPVSLGR